MTTPYLPQLATVHRSPTASDHERSAVSAMSAADLAVFAELAVLLADQHTSDVLVNGEQVWVDRGSGLEPVSLWVAEGSDALARRLIAAGGRHLDEVTPIADVRLGQVRVHAVLPPVALGGALISLRIARPSQLGLDELQQAGVLSAWQRAQLTDCLNRGESVLISGATGSGKTTLLRALCAELPAAERILTIEDVAELQIPHPHVVALEARQPNIEGTGAIELAELLRAALRMRPDRLMVGECRGSEIREFLGALNTGHSGGGTIHANTIDDVVARLEALGALAGLHGAALGRQVASAFGLVAHLERRDGRRRCAALARPRMRSGELWLEAVHPEPSAERGEPHERRLV